MVALKSVQFEECWQRCISCGVWFGFDAYLDQQLRNNKKSFYCPNGHTQAYCESEADRVRKDLAAKQKELDRERQNLAMERQLRIDTEARLEKEKTALKRQTKRVNAGVCPHCNRTFSQLQRHMQCKHSTELAK